MLEQLMEVLCLAPRPALGPCPTSSCRLLLEDIPLIACWDLIWHVLDDFRMLVWVRQQGPWSLPAAWVPWRVGSFWEISQEHQEREAASRKQQSHLSVYLSSCSQFGLGRVLTGNSDGTGVGGWEWPFLPAGILKYDCFPLPHTVLKTSLVWFKSTFGKPVLVLGCRGEMFMDSDWLCAPWKWLSSVRLWQAWPSLTLGLCAWTGVCLWWYRSTFWRAVRGPRDSLSLQTRIPVVPWRTHILICFGPSILCIMQAAADWVKS